MARIARASFRTTSPTGLISGITGVGWVVRPAR
jgi:hypothetical protein